MESVEIPFRLLQDVVDVTAATGQYEEETKEESLQWERNLSDQDMEFATVRQEEKVEVTEFLLSHFFPEVPIGKIVNMDVDLEVRPWIFDFIHSVLAAPSISIQIRQRSTGRILALAINVIENSGNPDFSDFIHPDRHPKMHMNLAFLEELSVLPSEWSSLSATDEKLFNIFMVAVDPNYGKRGLGSKLVRLSIQLAARLGFKTVVSQAVSDYAIKAMNKCGFRSIKQLLYDQFVYHGDTPLANNGDHQRAEYLVLQL